MSYKTCIRVITGVLVWFSVNCMADNHCAARQIKGKSVVCVCNETYCDTITREPPSQRTYVSYTSSQAGLRFNKVIGDLTPVINTSTCCPIVLQINPEIKYQTIEGFGGAVTDSAGLNWKTLSDALQKHVINSYFSENGLEYNMIRVPIGGADFSTRPYAYNELPENDTMLSNFSLAFEDIQYKIPMIKAAMQVSKYAIHVIGSTWSPPLWMKTKHQFLGSGSLKPEYYQTYADYHKKFIEKYTTEGILIWGITTTNEPSNCLIGLSPINCLGWTAASLGKWIANYLGPTIRNSTYKETKILSGDDQRLTLPYWFNTMVIEEPKVLEYIDGVAVHYYSDMIAPPALLSEVTLTHPEKFILATEASEGFRPWDKKVDVGSWQRAKNYATDIIDDLNHDVVGWLDWNLCLNIQGGPNWVANFVDSPIIVFPKKNFFIKQPMFYAMGHFSKFIPRGSRRVQLKQKHTFFKRNPIKSVGFLTPSDTIVVVLYNSGPATKVNIRVGNIQAMPNVDANAIVTVELPYTRRS